MKNLHIFLPLLLFAISRAINPTVAKFTSRISKSIIFSVFLAYVLTATFYLLVNRLKVKKIPISIMFYQVLSVIGAMLIWTSVGYVSANELLVFGTVINPILIVFLAYIFLGEEMEAIYVPIIVVVLSAYMLFHYTYISMEIRFSKYSLILLIGFLLLPFSYIFTKKALEYVSPSQVVFWRFLINSLVFLPILPGKVSFDERTILMSIPNFIIFVAVYFLAKVLKELKVGTVGIANYGLVPIFGITFNFLFLGERMYPHQILAAAIMFAGASIPIIFRKILILKVSSEDIIRIRGIFPEWRAEREIIQIFEDLSYLEKRRDVLEDIRGKIMRSKAKVKIYFEDKKEVIERAKRFFGDLNVELYASKECPPWNIRIEDGKRVVVIIRKPHLLVLETEYEPLVGIFRTLYKYVEGTSRRLK